MTAADGEDPVANLAALAERLGLNTLDEFDEMAGPVYWPDLTAEDAAAEWDGLRRWVLNLRIRFPQATKIPDCWYRHNDLVEALSALRDYERASFSSTAPPSGAVEWHRAFRDIEARYETWIRKLPCQAGTGRGHEVTEPALEPTADWDDFIRSDIDARERRQIAAALT
jgi:hypothetical protein